MTLARQHGAARRYADSRARAELLRAQQQELEAALQDLAPRLRKDRESLRLQAPAHPPSVGHVGL